MSELGEQVRENIDSRGLLRKTEPALVAVSGGVDSMVLLHLLHRLSKEHGWRLTVAHLNHCLRGRSSDADERLVRRTARRLGLKVVVGSAPVRLLAEEKKISIEMAARRARHEFLARTAKRLGIGTITLAHHADDQVELFFLRLLRGSGSEGLGGMKWRSASPADAKIQLVRPFLDQPKSALRAYAAEHRIVFREDASNALVEMDRNRIRHELLPLLRKKYQPGLDRVVPRVMEVLGAQGELVRETARDWLSPKSQAQSAMSKVRGSGGGSRGPRGEGRRARAWQTPNTKHQTSKKFQTPNFKPREGRRTELAEFETLPVAVQRECVRLQIHQLGVVADFELIEQLRLNVGRSVSVGGGALRQLRLLVREVEGTVRTETPAQVKFRPERIEVDLGGRKGTIAFGDVRLTWAKPQLTTHEHSSHLARFIRANPSSSVVKRLSQPALKGEETFDLAKIGTKLTFRHWQPGDRVQPIGMKNSVKLQDWFVNCKVPRAVRHDLIVGTTVDGAIFWVEGMRIGEHFKVTRQTNRFLQLRWERV